jgi:hypothetical protein
MDYDSFWSLMGDLCTFGPFICAVPSEGGSANLLGEFEVRHDGRGNVFHVKDNKDHVHLNHEKFVKLSFSYFDVGYGDEALVTVMGEFGKPMMKLYYAGEDPHAKYLVFAAKHAEVIEGQW